MAHKYATDLQMLSDFLQSGLDMLKEFNVPEMNAVKMRLTTSMKRDQMFIHSLLGYAKSVDESEKVHLQPLTHILGQPIEFTHKPVGKADTTPTDFEKQKFIKEVNDYYANFLGLTDEKLFNKSTLPGGEMIIRAVAKKAGYEEFEDGEIDVEYIAAVRLCIEQKAAEKKALKEAEKKTQALKK